MNMKKITVAMSGGVDSAAACAVLKEKGYDIKGATMRLGVENDSDIEAAQNVCKTLGIDFEVYDFTHEFSRDVITPFCESYVSDLTPNPCINCNIRLKFGAFLQRAMADGADGIATGHYARIENGRLLKAKNEAKDQSYVLYGISRYALSHTLFPLGDFSTKDEVRKYVKELCLPCADRPESQDICFIPDGDYASYLSKNGYFCPEGNFVNTKGDILGKHLGRHCYTIGQRRGLGVSAGKRIFVLGKNTEENTVILGDEEELYKKEIYCTDVNFIRDVPCPITAEVKVRYKKSGERAVIEKTENGVKCTFFESVRAPAPGQSAVFYINDEVIGGGIIR